MWSFLVWPKVTTLSGFHCIWLGPQNGGRYRQVVVNSGLTVSTLLWQGGKKGSKTLTLFIAFHLVFSGSIFSKICPISDVITSMSKSIFFVCSCSDIELLQSWRKVKETIINFLLKRHDVTKFFVLEIWNEVKVERSWIKYS